MFLPNLGAVLMKMNQVADGEQAIRKISKHLRLEQQREGNSGFDEPDEKIYTFTNFKHLQN